MPPTNVSPEVPTKKTTTKPVKEPEWKKALMRDCESKSIDARSISGAGETPAPTAAAVPPTAIAATTPPKAPKPKKPKEKKLADTLPKKNAQRAKGSISLNKTIEHPDAELKPADRRSPPCDSTDKLPPEPCRRPKTPPEEPKTPAIVPPAQKRKKKRDSAEKIDKPKLVPKTKTSLVKQPSAESIEEKTIEVVNQEPAEVKSDEIRGVTTAFNSCSFFEKIQQGVKAYFSSRSSFNPDDRTKKDGGIRTRGRKVGKGVKEEVKKSKSGNKIKNKYINPERVSLYDRLSFLGGHSGTFLPTKPKILRDFRKLKRKKLYRPKKCYVRIQIPRKGYFYRSTVGLQSPECAPLQTPGKTTVDPKSHISGLAPAPSKAACLPNKKVLKMQETPEHEADLLDSRPSDPFTPEYVEELLSGFGNPSLILASQFDDWVNDYVSSNWPDAGKEASFEDALVEFETVRTEGERPTSAIPENLNHQKTKNDISHKTKLPDPSWDSLIDCLNTALGRNHFVYNLEITQMNQLNESGSQFREPVLQSIQEEPIPARNEEGIPGTFPDIAAAATADDVTVSLMAGVDLHLELQNYLKAIESFQTTKSRTKNTLQCNFHDNYIPLKIYSSSQELQNRAEEYFDVNENRSGSSFDSATSHSPHLEEVTYEMLFDVTPDTGRDEFGLRKAKSEYDPGQPRQEFKNTIKRTAGITSFQVLPTDDNPMSENHSGTDSNDDYERIQPFDAANTGKKNRSTFSVDNHPPIIRELTPEQPPTEQTPPRPTPKTETNPQTEQNNGPKWSPTLQELIDIYNSVLKQNKKIRRNSNNLVTRCFSSHLFSFLNEKLKEKHYKSDLVHLSKDFRMSCKPQKLGKPMKGNSDLVTIEEYVSMFQEILQSSLSISQITRLNNVISGLQDYSEKNYNYLKDLDDETKKQPKESVPVKVKPKTPPPKVEPSPSSPRKPHRRRKIKKPQTSKPKKQTETSPMSTPPKTPVTEIKIRKPHRKSKRKLKQKLRPTSKDEIDRTVLPAPAELESILKSYFMNGNIPKPVEKKDKILVTVQLDGNQVLVNGFSYLKNDTAVTAGGRKSNTNGTSELIIENVTKKNSPNTVWWKNTKSSQLRIQTGNNAKKPIGKTLKKNKKQTKDKETDAKPPTDPEYKTLEHLKQFEYDQMQLRAQHPIEAIAELSESKISQYAFQSDDDEPQLKPEPPTETKILLGDIPTSPTAMTDALKAALNQKVYAKDLICGFGRSEEAIGKTMNRSCRSQAKRRLPPKKNKRAVAVRSMVELKKRPVVNKPKARKTQNFHRTCFCYSSLQNDQGKFCKKQRTTAVSRSSISCKTKPSKTNEKRKDNPKPLKETGMSSVEVKSNYPGTTAVAAETVLDSSTAGSSTDVFSNADPNEVEYLFSEVIQPPKSIPSTSEDNQPAVNVDSVDSIQKDNSFTSADSKLKDSSIALLPPSNCNDCVSFLAEMIHSDSFLVNIPHHAVSESKLKTLFKSSSEVKFYPGRLTDTGSTEEKPLVTFVLTPSQHQLAELPANQVTVVKKADNSEVSEDGDTEKDEAVESDAEEDRHQSSLKSIEEFITYLSHTKKPQKRKEAPTPPASVKKKPQTFSSRLASRTKKLPILGLSTPIPRKPFHECQKRKLLQETKPKRQKPLVISTPNQRRDKNGKQKNPDIFLDMVVKNLTRLLKNFNDTHGIGRFIKQDRKKRDNSPNAKKTNPGKRETPLSLQEMPSEIMQVIKTAIARVKNTETEEEQEQEEQMEQMEKEEEEEEEEEQNNPKKTKSVKTNEPKRATDSGGNQQKPTGEIALLDSLVSRETEGGDLKRKNSTYFDAVEKNPEEKIGGGGEQMSGDSNNSKHPKPTAEGVLNLKEVPKPKLNPLFTPSDEQLLSRDILGTASEDAIFQKISKSLQEGRVTYSLSLLESYLSKMETSTDCAKLSTLLTLVESKSKDIMLKMERTAWLKVLSLLEEVTQVLDKSDPHDKCRLESTKRFLDKIQLLNIKRLANLQNFWSSSFNHPLQQEDSYGKHVLDKIRHSLKLLKQKFTLRRHDCSQNLENLDCSELSTESVFRIHSTVSVHELREGVLAKRTMGENPDELKRKLQQQYACLQQLITAADVPECQSVPPEIQDVRRQVAGKIKELEQAFEAHNMGETSRKVENYWSKATSLLRLATSYRRTGDSSEGSDTPAEVTLERRPGYVDLMRGLMKAWDTRTTMSSITGECFR